MDSLFKITLQNLKELQFLIQKKGCRADNLLIEKTIKTKLLTF